MALNTEGYKAEILALITEMRERTEISDEEYADRWAQATEQYIKSATINYLSGLIAPTGAVTGTFNGTIE
ncbi:hypothetical protein GCM10007424_23850 [Flavobacterium suaedae]|uniref:Uncharacterized protein n=1 Tax=Flavobacterium suaedae TaxID=1767027 RepID=A0ABQ1K2L4_9FLAO|nr:hypothetical protein [Flavobacterium suaedae]GGB83055.1 hypothetical protein GCM10007424_23850 [Flavobacterium suaedae]